jgi:hypothetical protein
MAKSRKVLPKKIRVVKAMLTDEDDEGLIVRGVIMPDSDSLHYRTRVRGTLVKYYWTWVSTDFYKVIK